MADSLERFKSFIGKSETSYDVVTESAMIRFAATLDLEKAPRKGEPVPPGWHGGFFPASHRPSNMRDDGQSKGGGFMPAIPLPRRRIGGTRLRFHQPLIVGDEIKRVLELADIRVEDGRDGAAVTIVERSSIYSPRGLAVEEERDAMFLSEERAQRDRAPGAKSAAAPGEPRWKRVYEPAAALLFRYSAIRFNSHRIHYDRDYATKVEKMPGLAVQTSLISQLMIEMCRAEQPGRPLTAFGFETIHTTYDTGPFAIAGLPSPDGREAKLWALDPEGRVSMTASASFA